MDEKTPGRAVTPQAQAAYDAFWASPALGEEPPSPLELEAPSVRAAWEAAAKAADREITAYYEDVVSGLRALVAEILGGFHYLHQDFMECDTTPDEYAKWRERAGLDAPKGA